jgi:ABC-type multidrug transport system fused ATPase/permease subunit
VFWVDSKEGFTTSNTQIEIFFNDTHFLYVCGILLLIIIVACYSNLGAAVLYCKYASQHLHKALFGKVLVGSLIFFDNHSSGRVLNRFSKDMGMIDEVVPTRVFRIDQDDSSDSWFFRYINGIQLLVENTINFVFSANCSLFCGI